MRALLSLIRAQRFKFIGRTNHLAPMPVDYSPRIKRTGIDPALAGSLITQGNREPAQRRSPRNPTSRLQHEKCNRLNCRGPRIRRGHWQHYHPPSVRCRTACSAMHHPSSQEEPTGQLCMEFFSSIRRTPIRLYYSKFDTTGQQKSPAPAHKTPPLTANPH